MKRILTLIFSVLVAFAVEAQTPSIGVFYAIRFQNGTLERARTLPGTMWYNPVTNKFQFREGTQWVELGGGSGGGISGLTTSRVPFANSSTSLTDDVSFTFNGANNRLVMGLNASTTAGVDNVNFGASTALTGSWALTVAEASTIRGNNSLSSGWSHEVGNGINSFSGNGGFTYGTDNKNFGLGAYVGGIGARVNYISASQRGGFAHSFQVGSGDGRKPIGVEYLTANDGAGIISRNTSAQTAGHGSLAQDGFILGGIDHNIPSTSPRSVILGGNAIKARASDPDQVYVPNLNISSTPTTNDALSQVLVRDAITGKVHVRTAGSLGGGTGGGVADGDYGDIFVQNQGSVWEINSNAVQLGNIEAILPFTFLGNNSAITGDPRYFNADEAIAMLPTINVSGKGVLPAAPATPGYYPDSDGTWKLMSGGGGGITNSAVANEFMKSDGTNAIGTGVSNTTLGDIAMGLTTTGGTVRRFNAAGSSANVSIDFVPKGTGMVRMMSGNETNAFHVNNAGMVASLSTGQLSALNSNSAGNSVMYPFKVLSSTLVAPAFGIGTGIQYEFEGGGGQVVAGTTEFSGTQVTAGAVYSDFVVKTLKNNVLTETWRMATGAAGPRISSPGSSMIEFLTNTQVSGTFTGNGSSRLGILGGSTPSRRLHVEENTSSQNTPIYPLRLTGINNNSAGQAGTGTGIEFESEISGGNVVSNTMTTSAVNATVATASFDMVFNNISNGVIGERFRIGHAGLLKGTFTQNDALTRIISSDVNGNLYWRDAATLTGGGGTTYGVFTSTTNGLVPAPGAGSTNRYMGPDGIWRAKETITVGTNQIAYGSGTNNLVGESQFTYTTSTNTMGITNGSVQMTNTTTGGSTSLFAGQLQLDNITSNDNLTFTPSGIQSDGVTSFSITTSSGALKLQGDGVNVSGIIVIPYSQLPTSCTGQVTGTIYRDASNFLKVCP